MKADLLAFSFILVPPTAGSKPSKEAGGAVTVVGRQLCVQRSQEAVLEIPSSGVSRQTQVSDGMISQEPCKSCSGAAHIGDGLVFSLQLVFVSCTVGC